MVQGCGNKCIKYFFFLINFLLFALGGVVCGLALWIRFDNDFQNKVFGALNLNANGQNSGLQLDTLYIILYVIAAVGLVIFILGFFGCCGSSCVELLRHRSGESFAPDNPNMGGRKLRRLTSYFVLILIIFVVILAGGIYAWINKGNLRQDFINVWQQEFVNKYSTLPPAIANNVNNIHASLKCCGANGCQDFPGGPPLSCNCSGVSGPYIRKGCAVQIFDLIDGNILIIAVIGIAILLIELIAMIFACIMCQALKEKRSMNF